MRIAPASTPRLTRLALAIAVPAAVALMSACSDPVGPTSATPRETIAKATATLGDTAAKGPVTPWY